MSNISAIKPKQEQPKGGDAYGPEAPEIRGSDVTGGAHPPKRDIHSEARQAIEFLNRKAKRNYRPVQVNLDFCLARLREGYTLQDLKCVVVLMCRKWLHDEKMNEYLRPATLFNRQNFSQYIGLVTGPVVGDDREPDESVDIT